MCRVSGITIWSSCVCSDSGKLAEVALAADQTKVKAVLPSDWPWCFLPRPATCRGIGAADIKGRSPGPNPAVTGFPVHLARGNICPSHWTESKLSLGLRVMLNSFWRSGSSLRGRRTWKWKYSPSDTAKRNLQLQVWIWNTDTNLAQWKRPAPLGCYTFCAMLFCLYCSSFFPQHSSLQRTICPVSLSIHNPQGFQPLTTESHGDWRTKDSHGSCEVLLTHSYLMLHANKEQQIPQAFSKQGCERSEDILCGALDNIYQERHIWALRFSLFLSPFTIVLSSKASQVPVYANE